MNAILKMHENYAEAVYIAETHDAAIRYLTTQLSTDCLQDPEWLAEIGASTLEDIIDKYHTAAATGEEEVHFICDEGHGYIVLFDVETVQ